MKKFLFILLLIIIPITVFAQDKKTAVYFYSESCPHCQKVDTYFIQQGFYEKYDIRKMNMDDKENQKLLGKVFAAKGQTESGIPDIVIDDQLLSGDTPIIDNFEKTIDTSKGTTLQFIESLNNNQPKSSFDFSIIALLGAALADAANPCALAVLILLLATVISAKGKSYALLSGFMFSLAIFISYLFMGFGVYKAISAFNIGRYLSLGAGILAIIIALANFKDVFWYGKGFIMEVPLSWRPKMKEIIRKATSPWSAFAVGFVVSLFLVPCASGPYAAILARLAERVDTAKAIPLLVLYNLVFITPMVIVTLAMYFFNVRMSKLENWRQNNLRLLHAIIGTIMLLLGMYMIYTRV